MPSDTALSNNNDSNGDGIDWDLIDVRLALAEGPEGRIRRDKLFSRLDPNGNKTLSLTEVVSGLSGLLDAGSSGQRKKDEAAQGLIPGITNFAPAIKVAFNLARHRHHANRGQDNYNEDATVDRAEFHALLTFFRHYLELYVIFKQLDHGDNMLSEEEILPSVQRLAKWGIDKKMVAQKLKSEGGTIGFNHFAEWCCHNQLESLTFDELEGAGAGMAVITGPGRAGKGQVNWAEVDAHIPTALTTEDHDKRDALFKRMDQNRSGSLTMNNVQAAVDTLLKGDHAARKTGAHSDKLHQKYEAARSIIPGLRDTRGAVQCAFLAARDVNSHSASVAAKKPAKVKKRSHEDETVDRSEFHALLCYLRHYLELQMVFQEMDTSEDLRVDKEECKAALPLLETWGIDAKAVDEKFAQAKGDLKFAPFADWCLRTKLHGATFDHLENQDAEEVVEQESMETEALDEVMKEVVGASIPPPTPDTPFSNIKPLEEQPCAEASNMDDKLEQPEEELGDAFDQDFRNWGRIGTPKQRSSSVPPGMYSKSYGDLPMGSQGILKRVPHLKALSHVKSLPKWRFGEKRPSSFFLTNENPAPGSYSLPEPARLSKFREKSAYSFGAGPSRFGHDPHPGKVQPAPGQYGIPTHPVMEMQRKVGFGFCRRGELKPVISDGPGPGSYEVKSTLGGLRFPQKGKLIRRFNPTDALPGPGQYDPRSPDKCTQSHERSAPMIGFGTGTRTDYSKKFCQRTPGAGAYDPDVHKNFGVQCKAHSIKGRHNAPSSFFPYISPGPGTYDAHGTSFGY